MSFNETTLYSPYFPSQWKKMPLYELAEWQNGLAFKPSEFEQTGIPVIKISEVKSGISDQTKRTSKKFDSKYLLKNGDMLFCWSGQPQTSIDTFWWNGQDGWLNQHIFKVTPNECSVTRDFFYYLLKYIKPSFVGIASNKQTTGLGHVTKSDLQRIHVALPSFDVQKSIVSALKPLDERIEILSETNATLEAISQALFKSWFVDFDPVRAKMEGRSPDGMDEATAALFPDSLEESELGLVPKRWQALSFTETIDVIGGGTPKTSIPEYWNGEIPWFSVVDAPSATDVFVIDTEKHITNVGLNSSSTKLLPVGTTIISARGTVGRLALVGREMAMNQSCYGLRGKAGDTYFTYFTTCRLVETLKQRTHGSVFDTITRDTLAGVSVVYPSDEIIDVFEKTLDPVMERIKGNLVQAQTLATLRDTLLPRLISGQLRLPEVNTVA